MSKRYKIQIGNRRFSKTELSRECRKILKQPRNTILKGDDREIALWCLCQRRTGYSMSSAVKIKIIYYLGNNAFHYLVSKNYEAFSYIKAINFYGNQNSKNTTDVKKAFRAEIAEQISAFRKCELSKSKNIHLKKKALQDFYLVHTHHVIDFFVLLEDFCRINKINLLDCEIEYHPYFSDGYCLKDRIIAEQWQDFHAKHAKLKVVDAKTNTRKGLEESLPRYHYRRKIGGYAARETALAED